MKKIEYSGDDIKIKKMAGTLEENFQEILFKNMRALAADPTDHLIVPMIYYNTTLQKLRVLISNNPATWKTLAFES